MDTTTITTMDTTVMVHMDTTVMVHPFRYKLSYEMSEELFRFSKIHQYEDRETFKESWTQWLKDADTMVQAEIDRHIANEYRGDVLTKMYKSSRYYHRQKSMAPKECSKRKSYDSANHELIELMDSHIRMVYDLPPKIGFIQFCELHQRDEKDGSLKKKYKNRHYLIVRDKVV